jgi:tRNA dimethylallyltransferase
MSSKTKKLVVILGPTASGKTELAIKLAKKFNGEIVSADSRQVYKEMAIGTASPCLKMQNAKCKMQNDNLKCKIKGAPKTILINKIPHYLFHIISPKQNFNVAVYKKLAVKIIKDIQKRGKLPFLVGGTGLYIQAVVDNIEFPKVPPQKKFRRELEKKSEKELFEIYKKLDPRGAKFIEKENKRRLIRAIEVCKVTGRPFSEQRKKGKPLFEVLEIGLKLNREKLRERISKRIEKMFKMGLEKEVKKLVKKYGFEIPPMQTIGYQEWKDYFESKISTEELKEKIKTHTLQFAKRQMTWFKRDKRIKWIKNYKEAEKLIEKFVLN